MAIDRVPAKGHYERGGSIHAICNDVPVQERPPVRTAAGTSDQLVDAVLGASRALVAVAATSLAGTEGDVTLPQYRALVVLAGRGPQRVADLAEALSVNPSTATRMSDRLARKRLVRRSRTPADRRIVRVAITAEGRELIDEVTRRRRNEIRRIMRRLPAGDAAAVVTALRHFAQAAGEVPDQDWSSGWDL